jgi:hypothetical protein
VFTLQASGINSTVSPFCTHNQRYTPLKEARSTKELQKKKPLRLLTKSEEDEEDKRDSAKSSTHPSDKSRINLRMIHAMTPNTTDARTTKPIRVTNAANTSMKLFFN